MTVEENFVFKPIGHVCCEQKYRYEAPRQAVFADNEGCIELNAHCNFETALRDLEGFDRIWVIFVFHLNKTWKPTVRPPVRGDNKKTGVFATRSPHRPNPVGMSCVELVKVEGRRIYIKNFDILDGTPVLDIKPYIPRSDAFPNAAMGWLPAELPTEWEVRFAELAAAQATFNNEHSQLDLQRFCVTQLSSEPTNQERKRITREGEGYAIACRTWRIFYRLDSETHTVLVDRIVSNYTADELSPESDDIYGDKDLHREFVLKYGRDVPGN